MCVLVCDNFFLCVYACVGNFSNSQFYQGSIRFGLIFAIFTCRENINGSNVHTGPPCLLSLLEMVRHSIHCPNVSYYQVISRHTSFIYNSNESYASVISRHTSFIFIHYPNGRYSRVFHVTLHSYTTPIGAIPGHFTSHLFIQYHIWELFQGHFMSHLIHPLRQWKLFPAISCHTSFTHYLIEVIPALFHVTHHSPTT